MFDLNNIDLSSGSESDLICRIIMEEGPEAVITLTAQGIILYANKKFRNILDSPADEIKGRSVYDYLSDKWADDFKRLIENCESSVQSGEILFDTLTPDKNVLLSINLFPLPPAERGMICLAGIDITAYRKNEIELEKIRQELGSGIEARTAEMHRINNELSRSRAAALNMMEDAVEAKKNLEILNKELTGQINERKQAVEALQESEERFRSIFNNSLAVMLLSDSESGRIVDINPAALNFYGWTMEEMLSKKLSDIILLSGDEIKSLMSKAASEQRIHFDMQHRLANGGIRDVEIFSSNLKIGERNFLHFIIIDITERRRIEKINNIQYNIANAVIVSKTLSELLEAIHEELSKIIDSRNFFVAVYNEKTGMLRADLEKDDKENIPEWKADKSLTGLVLKKQKAILLRKEEILELNRKGEIDLIGTTAEAWLGVPLKIPNRILGAIVVQSYDNPDAYDDAAVDMLELVAHELSTYFERIEAEAESLKLIKAIEQSPVSVVITDTSGNIEYVNPHFTMKTGYTPAEVLGRNPRVLKSGETSGEVYKEMWMTILSGKIWHGEFHNRKKNGELFWEDAVISPVVNQRGIITNYFAIKEDITERKKMVEELIIAKDRAEQMSRLKSNFLANMSHELRTPLIGILGFSEIMLYDAKEDSVREMAAMINKGGTRLLETLNLILDLSRIEADKLEIQKETVDIAKVMRESVSLFQDQAVKKSLKMVFECKPENVISLSDGRLLSQIFNNVLNNAIKFTISGGINASLRQEGMNLEIRIKDSGIGISKEDQLLIWDEFRQVSEGFSRSFEGTGLGLTITKKFVEKLGGSISVESEVGVGSEFIISLPLESAENPESADIPKRTSAPTLSRIKSGEQKVLLVEDDPIAVNLITTMLGDNYNIVSEVSGSGAISRSKTDNFSLILMDINLGKGMSGIDAVREIRKLEMHKHTPIIAVTAFAMVGDREEFLAAGCDYYISKPFKKNKFLQLVDEALKKGDESPSI